MFLLVGVVELVADYVVCEQGKPLSPESARILVRFMLELLDYEVPLFGVVLPMPKDFLFLLVNDVLSSLTLKFYLLLCVWISFC